MYPPGGGRDAWATGMPGKPGCTAGFGLGDTCGGAGRGGSGRVGSAVGTAYRQGLGEARSAYVAVAPNGSRVVRARATGGKPQVVSARGLPSAVTALSMIDAKIGWARWANSSCRQGTTDCGIRTGMVITRDGGGTWAPASPR